MDTILYFTRHAICNFCAGAVIGVFTYIPFAILFDATLFGSVMTIGMASIVFGPASPE